MWIRGQQASSPYLQRDSALMERIRRLATRMVKGIRELPYEERLRRLNLFSLERRRLRGNLILDYNIFHGRLDFPHAEFFRLLRRKAPYSVSLPGPWNSLPSHIVNAPSLGAFKRSPDVAWPSLFPDRPWFPYLMIDFLHGFRRCLLTNTIDLIWKACNLIWYPANVAVYIPKN